MKKLLMLLFPLIALGISSCVDSKEDYDVTIICKNAGSLTDDPLKTSTITLQEGTYVDGDYLVKNGLIPTVEEYDYVEFQGPAGKVGKSTSYVLLYSKVKYKLTIKYRNFEVPDTSIPGVENKIIEVPIGTVVDETYLREEGCIIPISGLTFKSIDPIEQTLLDKSEVTIFYRTQTLDVTVKYRLKGDAITEIAPDKVFDNARYGSLVSQAEAVKTIDNYDFDSTNPALPYTVIEARDITVWYTRKINVILRYNDAEDPKENGISLNEPHDIPSGTIVDEEYLRDKNLIKTIYGYEFSGNIVWEQPNPQIKEGVNIDILYVKKTGNVKIEYWLGDPEGEPVKQGSAQTVTNYKVGDVIVDYAQLETYGLIHIPEGHEVITALVNGAEVENETVTESELVIKVYYQIKQIPVKIEYWKGKRYVDAVRVNTDNTVTIPYGTNVGNYNNLVELGCIDETLIPAEHMFDEMNPASFAVDDSTDGLVIKVYYKSNKIPVKIVYFKMQGDEVSTVYTDTSKAIVYDTEITSYEDLLDLGNVVDNAHIPEGGEFSLMDPKSVTIREEGTVIELYYEVPPTP